VSVANIWKPHVTVAAVVEQAGRFLLIWMTIDEIRASAARHRTPLVARCIEDYLAGRRYPLELLSGGPA